MCYSWIKSKMECIIALRNSLEKFPQLIPHLIRLRLLRRGAITVRLKIGEDSHVTLTPRNINSFIYVIKNLHLYRNKYSLKGNTIQIRILNGVLSWKLDDILRNLELFNWFMVFLLLKGKGGIIKRSRGGFQVDFEGIRWFCRDMVLADFLLGPLLPFTEDCEFNWFKKIVLEAKSFIDVGAYIGGYAVRACKAGLKVIAIEPNPENYNQLLENLELNKCSSYISLKVAAGDITQKALLLMDYDKSAVTSMKQDGTRYVEVDIKPLDEVIDINDLEHPVVAKIDVEGFEKRVLRGMELTLANIKYLVIESSDIRGVKELLGKKGYKLQSICYHRDWKKFNMFFVKRF